MIAFALAVVLLWPVIARGADGQRPALPAVIEFDHDGNGVQGFVVYATRREDGVQRRIDVGMPAKSATGRWRVTLPALDKGTWQLELAAYNNAGESPRAKAEPFEVRVEDVPKPPPAVKAPSTPKALPKSPAAAPPSPPQKQPPAAKKKGGALGKLWRVIVGGDGP